MGEKKFKTTKADERAALELIKCVSVRVTR